MALPRPPAIEYPPVNGNGLWVKLDSYGSIFTSIDSITWSGLSQPFTSIDAYWLYNGLAFGGGLFVAYGNRIVITGSSLPGSSWSSVINTGGNWISSTFNGTNWFLVDSEGRTATSRNSYPSNWVFTQPTSSLLPSYIYTA